jgi:hypothetical protein
LIVSPRYRNIGLASRIKEEKVLNEKIEQKVATDSTPKDLKSNYNEEI